MDRASIGAIVLAGGKSSRMGTEKGLAALCGRPMVSWVIDAVSPLVSDLLIVANAPGYEQFGHRVVPDDVPELGPVGGLTAGLRHAAKPVNFVLSCDIPLVPTAVLAHLLAHLGSREALAVESSLGRQPMLAIYRKRHLPAIAANIAIGKRSMQAALEAVGGEYLPFPGSMSDFDPRCLHNFNTPEDIAAHDCTQTGR